MFRHSEDKLKILAEFDSSSSTETNVSKIERLIDEKSREQIIANTEKKITSSSRNMTNKAWQVNFDKINIENCYRSSYQAFQNKKIVEEIKFLKEQISEKEFIIRELFSLKLSNRAEDNLFHKVRKNTNGKNTSESCINDEIAVRKCVSGPIKDDTAVHKKNSYNQYTDEDLNNLSTTSISKCKTSENNAFRTTETPNNNDVINDNLAAPARKRNFEPTPHHSSSGQLKPNLIKVKILLQ